ncbi:hypothetical protein POSPLADRAFT_1150989 [Postia placenta MAD-698-R-SB12]|uniref:GRAM domain-containing protein n=1 Tax=Postia placenta MAD-698-R-SB12 TaxID=670580 RepID=A0A1X6MT09_9APHY|nr:hypothetical protein POSPLADRAFT_1150989 [Postia placenta MAD-698-R-SB12]OSX59505.1 hypothetical protein POSPLADRAFT_1150989 [Postia placenta MAD-698-R-SB12]
MALNCAMLSPSRAPIPLPNELTIRTIEGGVELSLIVPDAPPAGSSSSGGSGGTRKLKDVGRLWLTDQRLIFVSDGAPRSALESLSVPLTALLSTKFEQPYFGSNYLEVDIRPSRDGGLSDGTTAEIRFKDKGLFEFVSALEKTRERAVYMKRQSADDEDEGLPSYSPPEPGPSYSARVPDEAPPGYDA